MIKDISKIREYLNGYVEVELPYVFKKNSSIQYITCDHDEEGNISCDSFWPNSKFIRRLNDIIILESNKLIKRVPIYIRDKEGVFLGGGFLKDPLIQRLIFENLRQPGTIRRTLNQVYIELI